MRIPLHRAALVGFTALIASGGALGSVRVHAAPAAVTLKVAFQVFGPPPHREQQWVQMVANQLSKSGSNIKIQPVPIVASEGDYYTKVDLMMRSASTAPDIVREDSFLIGSDVTAGYLAPLDSCLKGWPQYKQQWYPKMQAITTFQGHNYGVMNGTDDRLVWYNKHVFQKAGLPTSWQPKSWNDILKAASTIKKKVKGVTPMNLYSGIPMDEASTMQGFEMLLYGTKDPLYDYATKKWVISSKGFLNSLKFVQQVYNPTNLLGPSNDVALSPQAGTIITNKLLPEDKLGIDIDGSWLPNTWYPSGSRPWKQWTSVMGHAEMPSQSGSAPQHVTLSGGWAFSIASRSNNKAAACKVLQQMNNKSNLAWYDVAVANISPRKDVVSAPTYAKVPLNNFFTSMLSFTQFRPAFPEYPRVSNQVDVAMENVMSGMKPEDAMKSYSQAVTGIVGQSNTESR